MKFSDALKAAYEEEPGDLRYSLTCQGVGADNIEVTFTTKWLDAVTNADNSPVIRTTEVVLNYVEAKAESDGAVTLELVDWMNILRGRAGLPDWSVGNIASKDTIVEEVLEGTWGGKIV